MRAVLRVVVLSVLSRAGLCSALLAAVGFGWLVAMLSSPSSSVAPTSVSVRTVASVWVLPASTAGFGQALSVGTAPGGGSKPAAPKSAAPKPTGGSSGGAVKSAPKSPAPKPASAPKPAPKPAAKAPAPKAPAPTAKAPTAKAPAPKAPVPAAKMPTPAAKKPIPMANTPQSTPPAGKTPQPPGGQHPTKGQPVTAVKRSDTGQANTTTGHPATGHPATGHPAIGRTDTPTANGYPDKSAKTTQPADTLTAKKTGPVKKPDDQGDQGAVAGRSTHPTADQNAPAAPAFHLSQSAPSALNQLPTPSGKMPGGLLTATFDKSGKPVFGYGTPGTPGWTPLPSQPDSIPPASSGTGGPTNASNGAPNTGGGSGSGGGPGTLPQRSAAHHVPSTDPAASNADPHHPNPGDSLTPPRGPPHTLSDDQLYREGAQDQNDPEELHQLVPSYNPSQGRPTREQLIQAGRALLPQEGALIAHDRQQLHDLVPGYNPALAPTPDQLTQAGAAIVGNRQHDQANGDGQLCTNTACALKGHVPDAAGMQKGLDTLKGATSYLPEYGAATPLANAYQQFRDGHIANGFGSLAEAGAGLAPIPGLKLLGEPIAKALGKLGDRVLPAAGKGLKNLAETTANKIKKLFGKNDAPAVRTSRPGPGTPHRNDLNRSAQKKDPYAATKTADRGASGTGPSSKRGSSTKNDASSPRRGTDRVSNSTVEPNRDVYPDLRPVRRKKPVQGGGAMRRRWLDKKNNIWEEDRENGTLEKYNKTGKKHLGEFDAQTGEQNSPGIKGRTTPR